MRYVAAWLILSVPSCLNLQAEVPLPNPCYNSVSVACREFGFEIVGELEYDQIPHIVNAAQIPEGEILYKIVAERKGKVLLLSGLGSRDSSSFPAGHDITLKLKDGQWYIFKKEYWIT